MIVDGREVRVPSRLVWSEVEARVRRWSSAKRGDCSVEPGRCVVSWSIEKGSRIPAIGMLGRLVVRSCGDHLVVDATLTGWRVVRRHLRIAKGVFLVLFCVMACMLAVSLYLGGGGGAILRSGGGLCLALVVWLVILRIERSIATRLAVEFRRVIVEISDCEADCWLA